MARSLETAERKQNKLLNSYATYGAAGARSSPRCADSRRWDPWLRRESKALDQAFTYGYYIDRLYSYQLGGNHVNAGSFVGYLSTSGTVILPAGNTCYPNPNQNCILQQPGATITLEIEYDGDYGGSTYYYVNGALIWTDYAGTTIPYGGSYLVGPYAYGPSVSFLAVSTGTYNTPPPYKQFMKAIVQKSTLTRQ